jgi:8-amino-7-oxononanoate synthase
MGIFDKFQKLAETRKALEKNSSEFFSVVIEKVISPTEVIINGNSVVLAGGNNYLGLTFHSECIRAACDEIHKDATGTTVSRVANGTYSAHVALEQEAVRIFGRRENHYFSTGYIACLAMVSTLVGREEVILWTLVMPASMMGAGWGRR